MSRRNKLLDCVVHSTFGAICLLALCACQQSQQAGVETQEREKLAAADTRPRGIRVEIHDDGSVSVDGRQIALDQLEQSFAKRSAELAETGDAADGGTVRVSAAAAAPYVSLRKVYETASRAGVHHFELQLPTQKFLHAFETAAPNVETFVPPLKVHVEAADDGSVEKIVCTDLSGPVEYVSIEQLQQHLHAFLGDERGPGSIQPESKANVSADDQMKFRYFAEVLDAVAFDTGQQGRTPLIASVWPLRYRYPDSVVEEIEEFEIEDFPELDVPVFDDIEPAREIEVQPFDASAGAAADPEKPGPVVLLCRLYLGWNDRNPALERGVQWLSELGPALETGKTNMYYNYFASQVMALVGGEPWTQWKDSLVKQLIAKQSRLGDSAGSWYVTGDEGSKRGGRLYCTSLAVLTLTTQAATPIKKATDDEFPLE